MTLALPTLAPALAPVTAALATVHRVRGAAGVQGLYPGLVVPEHAPGWSPASDLVDGSGLDTLLDAAKRHWDASPHAAVALAWRSYTYWLTMPVALGWATARRVPLTSPDDVLVSIDGDQRLLTLGLRRPRVAVLPDDPLAQLRDPAGADVTVVDSEQELLTTLRTTLRDHHLDPLLQRLRHRGRLGARTLLGSLAHATGQAVLRGMDAPTPVVRQAVRTLLAALDVADLVEIVDGPDGPELQRRTCCLAFTLPEPKVCGSCCLR